MVTLSEERIEHLLRFEKNRIEELLRQDKIAEAYNLQLDAYELDRERELVPLARITYRLMQDRRFGASLHRDMIGPMLELVRGDLWFYAANLTFGRDNPQAVSDAETISTIFIWAAGQQMEDVYRKNLLGVAGMRIQEAIKYTAVCKCEPHIHPLLLLNRARLSLLQCTDEERASASKDVHEALNLAVQVTDPFRKKQILREAVFCLARLHQLRAALRRVWEFHCVPRRASTRAKAAQSAHP